MKHKTMTVDVCGTTHIDTDQIPWYVARNLAQAAFRAIHKAWEDPAIRADYEQWKKERQKAKMAEGELHAEECDTE